MVIKWFTGQLFSYYSVHIIIVLIFKIFSYEAYTECKNDTEVLIDEPDECFGSPNTGRPKLS